MILQQVLFPALLILAFQLLVNIGFAFLIKTKSIKIYRRVSYFIFIGFAVSLPAIHILRLVLVMGHGAPDPLSFAIQIDSILFWIANIIGAICLQLIFNQLLLPGIVNRKRINIK